MGARGSTLWKAGGGGGGGTHPAPFNGTHARGCVPGDPSSPARWNTSHAQCGLSPGAEGSIPFIPDDRGGGGEDGDHVGTGDNVGTGGGMGTGDNSGTPPALPPLTMAAVGSGAVSQPDAEAVDVRGAAERGAQRGAL